MTERTPAQRFRDLARRAQALNRRWKQLEQQQNRIRRVLDALESEANQIVTTEIGFKVDDLVVDEMGVVYRLDSVSGHSLNWTYGNRDSVTTLTKATERFYVRGIALHKNGLPRWSQARGIRGKLKKYEPEAQ